MKLLRIIFLILPVLFVGQAFGKKEKPLEIFVTLSPVGDFSMHSTQLKGTFSTQGDKVVAQNVTLPIKSLDSENDLRNGHIQKYFEADKFPQATLEKAVGKNGKFVGVLNVHGHKKQIKGTYVVEGNILKAEFPTKLSEFKIEQASFMGVKVEDDVTVKVRLPAGK